MSPPVADSTKDVEKVEKKQAQRRINKPLIEKRRRARINECLTQLKAMVLEASDNPKSPRSSKLEKADILEMTVEFIKKRMTSSTSLDNSPSYGDKEPKVHVPVDDYVAGYSKCIQEISHFLEQTQTVNETIKQDVVSHISQRLQSTNSNKGTNDYNVKTSDKIPIIPIKKRKLKHESNTEQEAEVIDLSVKEETGSAMDDVGQIQPLNLSTMSAERMQDIPNSHQKSSTAQMPIGFLCGSQIMLLVQVPQTMTSSQHCVTSQFNHLQRNDPSNDPSGIKHTQTPVIPKSQSEIRPNVFKHEPSTTSPKPNTSITDQIDHEQYSDISKHETEAEKQTQCTHNSSVITSGNDNSGAVPCAGDHWRPW